MSATIFCTFDQQDIADLAMGRLRNSVRDIHSIQYLTDFSSGVESSRRQESTGFWGFGYMAANHVGPDNAPSRPVSVKIVCGDGARDLVVGKLVNLHAYRIVAS